MAHRTARIALTALTLAGLAACGSDDSGEDGTASSDTALEASTDDTATDDTATDDPATSGDAGVGASTSAADCTATGQVTGAIQADLADADVVVNPGIDDSQALYDVTLPDGEVISFFAFADQAGNAVINTAENSTWSDFASDGIQLGADLSGGTFDITMSGFDADANSLDDVTVTGEISCG